MLNMSAIAALSDHLTAEPLPRKSSELAPSDLELLALEIGTKLLQCVYIAFSSLLLSYLKVIASCVDVRHPVYALLFQVGSEVFSD